MLTSSGKRLLNAIVYSYRGLDTDATVIFLLKIMTVTCCWHLSNGFVTWSPIDQSVQIDKHLCPLDATCMCGAEMQHILLKDVCQSVWQTFCPSVIRTYVCLSMSICLDTLHLPGKWLAPHQHNGPLFSNLTHARRPLPPLRGTR